MTIDDFSGEPKHSFLYFTKSLCKSAGSKSTSSDIGLSTAQFDPDYWAFSFLIPFQLHMEHIGWLLIRTQNSSTCNAIPVLAVSFVLLLWYEGAIEMDLAKALTITDSARIWIHDHWLCLLTDTTTITTVCSFIISKCNHKTKENAICSLPTSLCDFIAHSHYETV